MILNFFASYWMGLCTLKSSLYMRMALHSPPLGTKSASLGMLNKGLHSVNNNAYSQKTWASTSASMSMFNKGLHSVNNTHIQKTWASTSTSMGMFTKGLHSVNYNTHIQKTWAYVFPRACLESIKSVKSLVGQQQHSRVSLGELVNTTAANQITAMEGSSISALEANEDVSAISTNDLGGLTHGIPLAYQSSQLQSGKLVVAVDIDEVLGSFLLALNTFIAERYSLSCTIAEYHVYNFDKVWNCSLSEGKIFCTIERYMLDHDTRILSSTRVHEFFKSSHFRKGIQPIPGAYPALLQLTPLCHFSVVTSRQNAIKEHTIEWVERHYSGLFREIHFGNHFAIDGVARPKSEICKSFGAQILIDDNPGYALDCAENGIEVLLFDYQNGYPWCKIDDISSHPLITKVQSWQEVQQHLAALVLL